MNVKAELRETARIIGMALEVLYLPAIFLIALVQFFNWLVGKEERNYRRNDSDARLEEEAERIHRRARLRERESL